MICLASSTVWCSNSLSWMANLYGLEHKYKVINWKKKEKYSYIIIISQRKIISGHSIDLCGTVKKLTYAEPQVMYKAKKPLLRTNFWKEQKLFGLTLFDTRAYDRQNQLIMWSKKYEILQIRAVTKMLMREKSTSCTLVFHLSLSRAL